MQKQSKIDEEALTEHDFIKNKDGHYQYEMADLDVMDRTIYIFNEDLFKTAFGEDFAKERYDMWFVWPSFWLLPAADDDTTEDEYTKLKHVYGGGYSISITWPMIEHFLEWLDPYIKPSDLVGRFALPARAYASDKDHKYMPHIQIDLMPEWIDEENAEILAKK